MDIIKIEKIKKEKQELKTEQWKILLQYEGVSILTIEEMEIQLEKGSICIMPPAYSYIYAPIIEGMSYELTIRDFRPFGEKRVFLLCDDAENSLVELCELIIRYWNKSDLNIRYAVINSLGDAFYHALAGIYAQSENHDFRIERVVDIMYANISNSKFNLGQCLAGCGYSVGHFRKLFKKMTGTSPSQYMNRIRIDYAKSQMHQFGKSKSLKEIALECGFEDSLYFSRVFRKQEGMSPQEYRNCYI